MIRFNGQRDPDRRDKVEQNTRAGKPMHEQPINPDGTQNTGWNLSGLRWGEYRKTATTFAVRIDEPFEVDTLEGLHTGKPGDFLAIGAGGEMYPIDAAIFAATYARVDE